MLRQCEPTGYITQQLSYKYDKTLKKLLKTDWEEQKNRMKNEVATYVMVLVCYDRFRKRGGLRKLVHDKNKMMMSTNCILRDCSLIACFRKHGLRKLVHDKNKKMMSTKHLAKRQVRRRLCRDVFACIPNLA